MAVKTHACIETYQRVIDYLNDNGYKEHPKYKNRYEIERQYNKPIIISVFLKGSGISITLFNLDETVVFEFHLIRSINEALTILNHLPSDKDISLH
jgi:hypothetical protein